MNVEDVLNELLWGIVTGIIAGTVAVTNRARERRNNKNRTKSKKKLIGDYAIEFFVGFFAGVLMYCLALPKDLTRLILIGILAGINANFIWVKSVDLLGNFKASAIRDIGQGKIDTIGEEDNQDDGEGQSN